MAKRKRASEPKPLNHHPKPRQKTVVIQTVVQCVLGVVDEQGNVRRKVPLQIELDRLEASEFATACAHLVEARSQLEVQGQVGEPEPPKPNGEARE